MTTLTAAVLVIDGVTKVYRLGEVENVALVTDLATPAFSPEEALTLVGLEERFDHFPSQLSGGEQQRAAIARAIAKRPDVLGTTTAIITHNAVVADMTDRVLQLADGRIVQDRHNPHRVAPEELRW